jgi:hypothetical protein
MTQGFIYILTNPSMPGLVKIGKTTRLPDERMRDMYATGVPHPFTLAWSAAVADCNLAEREIHTRLARFRTNPRREFFRVTVDIAIDAAREVTEKIGEVPGASLGLGVSSDRGWWAVVLPVIGIFLLVGLIGQLAQPWRGILAVPALLGVWFLAFRPDHLNGDYFMFGLRHWRHRIVFLVLASLFLSALFRSAP